MNVAGWDLDADDFVVFLDAGVGLSIRLVVDVPGDFLSKTMAKIAELFVVAVDLVWVVAVGALAGVGFEVVRGPALRGIDRA